MIPSIDPNSRALAAGRRAWPTLVGVFAFACFLPYPAAPIGNNTGLQVSQLAAMAALPVLLFAPPSRQLHATLLLITPVLASTFANVMKGGLSSTDVMIKEAIALGLALIVVWPSTWAAGPRTFRRTLGAAAAAILAHVAVGLLQGYSFASGTFPLLFLYHNPSFKSMQEWSGTYAMYVKRPCGIFPEPSAMAASIGPWLVVLGGLLLEPGRSRGPVGRLGRLEVAAVLGGMLLLALSKSGMMLVVAAGLMVVGLSRVRFLLRSTGLARIGMMLLLIVGAVALLGYAASKFRGRELSGRLEDSWGLRGASIAMGLRLNTDPIGVVFGVGPGQSTPIVQATWDGPPIPEFQGEVAIWSALVRYYAETGLLGAMSLAVVMLMAARAIVASAEPTIGLAALGVWTFGAALATSYMPLSAIWLFLGAALSWDRLFPRPARPSEPWR